MVIKKSLMRKFNYIFGIIAILTLSLCLSSCGGNSKQNKKHACCGTWKTSFVRDNRRDIREEWVIEIKSDGTCYACNEGFGGANYKENYKGYWQAISSDAICMEMKSDRNAVFTNYLRSDGVGALDEAFSIVKMTTSKH